jgi:hypothetical protein
MMKETGIAETSVNVYESTRRNIPEDCYHRIRRRENMTSHLLHFDFSKNLKQGQNPDAA